MIKISKFDNFWVGSSCHRVRSMKKEYGNFLYSHEIILKQKNYIVIFGKHLTELYWIVLMCLYILGALLTRRSSNIKP